MSTTLISTNPADGTLVWEGIPCSAKVLENKIVTAKRALTSWAKTPVEERAVILTRYADILKEQKDLLARSISQEMGKTLWESLAEVESMIHKVPISIEAHSTRCPEKSWTLPTGTLSLQHRPHGILALLGPFNFPAHLPNGHFVPALLAGNAILFKPSEKTPHVADILSTYLQQAGLPEGLFQVVHGGAQEGAMLTQHPDISGVLFTGSWRVGSHLAEIFSKTPWKILALEMGGNNPLIVTSFEDVQAAAYQIVQSAFLTSGQRCTCTRRLILVKNPKSQELLDTLVKMTSSLHIGAYDTQPTPFMGPLVDIATAQHLLQSEEELLALGGLPLLKMQSRGPKSAFLTPGVLDMTHSSASIDHEFFGPLLQVFHTATLDDAITLANQTGYGLAASLFSTSPQEFAHFSSHVRAGIINWNIPTTGASSQVPFGGLGKSGNLRPSAYYAADYCSYPVASLQAEKITLPATLAPGICP